MLRRAGRRIAIVGECQYTANGLSSLLGYFFYNETIVYKRICEIPEKDHDMTIIAVLDEHNINYNDIVFIKRCLRNSPRINAIIMCEEILCKILRYVFNIECLYISSHAGIFEIKEMLAGLLRNRYAQPDSQTSINSELTGMETRILMLLAEGHSVTEIARQSNRSFKTISSHKIKLMRKMGVPNTQKSLSIISLYLHSLCSHGDKAA